MSLSARHGYQPIKKRVIVGSQDECSCQVCSASRLCTGVRFRVNFLQALGGDVGIHLGRGDAGVAEQFLDQAQIGSVGQKMGGEGMAQDMWE